MSLGLGCRLYVMLSQGRIEVLSVLVADTEMIHLVNSLTLYDIVFVQIHYFILLLVDLCQYNFILYKFT